ncbi:hypothetical protein [Vibrio scophthalmi]|uniref:Uncharacterized protein n=1 Tax=Vibrio scophthalmi TaxID=45658 RepID=A0A1C7FHV1_9VIBR|nr:hypothetical protein [Vibrio scophthalmi]ANU39501.1 hypothetical protein VSVS05_04466 [Vibrio scophthalmi]
MIVFPNVYSVDTINRRFEVIDQIRFAGIDADFLWDSTRLMACVVSTEIIDDDRRQVIASIEMQQTEWMNNEALAVERYWQQDPCQIQGVVVQPNFQEFGLATFMYEMLVVRLRMVIVSDNEQYAGGKALWKHIAKKSKSLTVYVFDSKTAKFFPYHDNERMPYTGSNIDDDIIWSLSPNEDKHPIVLIAESR